MDQSVCNLHHSFCYGVLTSVFDDTKADQDVADETIDTTDKAKPCFVNKVESEFKVSAIHQSDGHVVYVTNPLKNIEVQDYANHQWSNWVASFSPSILKLASISREVDFIKSNQVSESKFRD